VIDAAQLASHLNLEGLQVVAPSYRGHCDSDKPAKGYTLDGFAEDVLAVADTVGAKRYVLVGSSMSGKYVKLLSQMFASKL
jgi:non-heme chloroperoxidase